MKKNANSTFGIVGLGRFGTALAITLAEAGKEVIVVDQNEEKVKAMRQYTEYAFVCDNLSKATLSEVGIQNCDTVIVCIGSRIDTSILTTLNVVSLGVPHVISKATSQDQGAVLEKIGAEVVYPERDMAIRLGKKPPVRKLPGFHFPGQRYRDPAGTGQRLYRRKNHPGDQYP